MSGKRIRWITTNEAAEEMKLSVQDVQTGPDLKKPEQLIGFPVFDKEVKSLLAKNLTREMWWEL